MGKGQKGNRGSEKGKGFKKSDNKSNKFKQRTPQNKRQLARLDQITGKNRSDSQNNRSKGKFDHSKSKGKDFNKNNDKPYNKDRNFSKDKPYSKDRGFNKDKSFSRDKSFNRDKSFSKDRSSSNDRGNNRKGGRDSNSRDKFVNFQQKTKPIKKYGFHNRQKNPFKNDEQSDSQQINTNQKNQKGKKNQLPAIKGNPLFQIIPQGMNDEDQDDFAALGANQQQDDDQIQYHQQQIQGQQMQQQQGDFDQQQQDGEQIQGEQFQDDQQLGEQEEQGDFDEEQLDGQQGQQYQEQGQQQGQQQQQEEGQQLQQGQQMIQQQAVQGQQPQQQQQQQQQNNVQLPDFNDKQPIDISVLSLKIQQTIQILMNVQKLGNGKPRKYHLQQLKKMIHQYYGYNFELIAHFLDFLNPAQMVQFFESNEGHRPLTIRTNTLKTRRKQLAQSLIQRGVNLDPLAEWSKVGIKIYETKVPIGATPQYLAGHYMLQSASSLLPVIALDPQVGQKILDMASAPGGKTTYIAQLMKNTGSIFANDLKKQRLRALQFNLYRLGITNTAVICRDGRKMPSIFPGTFDRVLLDAPCTGLGIIAKDHSIKANRLLLDIYKNSHLQKQLLLAAIDCCKVNGTIVYSTCSVSPLENQQVVNYALKRRFIKIVDANVQVGQEGLTKFVQKRYHNDLKKTRRIYPHIHNMDGFYLAKIIKIGKGKRQIQENQEKQQNKYQQSPINNQDIDQ